MRASKLSDITTLRPLPSLRWSVVRAWLVEWRNRARSRRELSSLSDDQLWDIGITRGTGKFEASKPFGESECPAQVFSEASASG
jgi:uncharacterized protein YjiS (DUF1127 family)